MLYLVLWLVGAFLALRLFLGSQPDLTDDEKVDELRRLNSHRN